MNRYRFSMLFAAVSLLLSACSTVVVEAPSQPGQGTSVAPLSMVPAHMAAPGGSYVVAKGDTMYSIAFRNRVDYRDLARWNGIAVPYTIWPGQKLRLSPPVGGAAPVPQAAVAHANPSPATPAAPSAPVFETVPPAQASSSSSPSGSAPAVAAATHATAASTAVAPAAPVTPATASTVVPVAGEPKPVAPPPPPPTPVMASGHTNSAGGVTWRWPADGQIIKRFAPGDAVPGIEIAGNAGDPVRAAADGVVVYSGNGLVGYGELVIIKHSDSLLSAYGHNSKRLVTEGQHVSAGQVIAQMGSSGASRVELSFQIRKDGNPVDPLSYLPAK